MKKILYTLGTSILLGSFAQAETLDFTDLNTLDGAGNALQASGSPSVLTVTRTNPDNNFNYAVEYTGDIDGTTTTVNFNIFVEGLSGTIASAGATFPGTDGSTTIGSTDADVAIDGSVWKAGGDSLFEVGESLKFTITGLTSSVGTAVFDGFGASFLNETGNFGHQTVIGGVSGVATSDLTTYSFDNTQEAVLVADTTTLYVSSLNGIGTNGGRWGVESLDFGITVAVPEPSAYGLLAGLTGLVFVMVRRRSA